MRIVAKTADVGGKVAGFVRIVDAIGGEGASARGIMEHLDKLRESGATDLTVSIHSPGGDAFAGLAIHDAIRAWDRGARHVRVRGLAASAASVVMMAGDKITLSPNSMVMIHGPKAQLGGLFGSLMSADDLRKVQDKLEACRATMASVYAKRTGKTVAECSKIMEKETWLTAKDAVKQGFADAVEDDDSDSEKDSEDVEACDRFRLVAEAAWEDAPPEARALLALNPDQPEQNQLGGGSRKPESPAKAVPEDAPAYDLPSFEVRGPLAFSPDQPCDENERWTDEGGAGRSYEGSMQKTVHEEHRGSLERMGWKVGPNTAMKHGGKDLPGFKVATPDGKIHERAFTKDSAMVIKR